jgi:predicted flap endonuclease-1-like 5' DNA nuclease
MGVPLGIALEVLGIALGFVATFLFAWGKEIEVFVGVLLVVAGAVIGFVVEWLIDLGYRRNRELQQQVGGGSRVVTPQSVIVTGDGQADTSEALTEFLRQRDEELHGLRDQLNEHDRQMDALQAEFDTYQKAHPDDLTRIKGIGPVFQWKLRDAGFNTYKQLAGANPDQLRRMLDIKSWQRVNVEYWIEQARDWAQKGSTG